MRKTFSLLALLAGSGLLAASAFGSVSQSPTANTFRWSLAVDIDHVDPALAYYTQSWALEHATGAMLFNYPDALAPRGARLVPEVAAGFPTISRNGRTYTFRLRTTYRFSDGRRVRAASFVRAFERARNRRPETPAARFISDVVDFAALGPYRLRIRLRKPAGDLLALLAMPFFMAIPADTPDVIDGIGAPVVSAGPYFVREWTKNRRIILERNRFYRGPRPHRVNRIHVDIGLPLETIRLNIDGSRPDTGDIPAATHAELGDRFGVRRRSPGRYFANPTSTILYLAFNHDRPLFGGPDAAREHQAQESDQLRDRPPGVDEPVRSTRRDCPRPAPAADNSWVPRCLDLSTATGSAPGSRARRRRAAEQHPWDSPLQQPLAVAAGLPARAVESPGDRAQHRCPAAPQLRPAVPAQPAR